MANQEHLDILRQGIDVWNTWREQHPEIRPDLSRAHLSAADLFSANLSAVDLRGADLSSATLFSANLRYANLSGANLRYANLRDADLSGADLYNAYLRYANLSGADLSGANLRYANLSGADLSGANLSGADLSSATLFSANLSAADLRGATLSNANLRDADLSAANLSAADLKGARLAGTTFANVDLRSAKGLVEVDHVGPSIVQLHTVQLPQDGSMLHFLRGTGLPDEWIDFYRTSVMQPIVYHSCFISYSHKNEDLAKRLYADLQSHGVRCWFAPEDLKIGEKIRTGIDEAIHLYDKLLLILSRHSIASGWVEHEVKIALAKERKEKRTVLFPVRVDKAVLESPLSWSTEIRHERNMGDFTRWKNHDEYQEAFNRLLRDLKTEAQKRES